jgi:hypothetical protein
MRLAAVERDVAAMRVRLNNLDSRVAPMPLRSAGFSTSRVKRE